MTENKRFYLDETGINDREYEFGLLGEDELVDIINELNDENIELHIQNDFLKNENQHMRDLVNENKIFREALKELKEIGDYQAMRIKELDDMNSLIEDEIDKKIAVLIDAKIQCFQNEDEVLFGKIKFGIQILNELKEVMLND